MSRAVVCATAESILSELSRELNDEKTYLTLIDTMLRIHRNINDHPQDPRYRTLSKSCVRIQQLLRFVLAMKFMHYIGWKENATTLYLVKDNYAQMAVGILLQISYSTKRNFAAAKAPVRNKPQQPIHMPPRVTEARANTTSRPPTTNRPTINRQPCPQPVPMQRSMTRPPSHPPSDDTITTLKSCQPSYRGGG